MVPWFGVSGALVIAWGSWHGLFVAPPDYQQGDAFRIIYVHVPSAYLSMAAYMMMALSAGIGLIWGIKLSHAVADTEELVLLSIVSTKLSSCVQPAAFVLVLV